MGDVGRKSTERGPEFWYARRAFLNSYHFTCDDNNADTNNKTSTLSFKQKLRNRLKHLNQKAISLVPFKSLIFPLSFRPCFNLKSPTPPPRAI